MDSDSLQEGHQHKQKGWEHVCTGLVLVAEYLAVRYSIVWLGWSAALFLWFAVRSYARHYLKPRFAKVAILSAIPLIIAGTYYVTREPKKVGATAVQAQTPTPQQPPPASQHTDSGSQSQKQNSSAKKKSTQQQQQQKNSGGVNTQQQNSGDNSPNINDSHDITINYGATLNGGFHEEVPDMLSVTFGSVTGTFSVQQARRGRPISVSPIRMWSPFEPGHSDPVCVQVKGDRIMWSFKSWDSGLPIEVNDNVVKIGNLDVDRNFGDRAFEVVNKNGAPLFQMIRKTVSSIQINGVFNTGKISQITGKPLLLWISEETGMRWESTRPAKWNLKPIFKYPSWKYPGVFADN